MSLDRTQLQSLYGRRARRYDFTANLYYLIGFREYAFRRRAVEALRLPEGGTVVEVGCGTGLNLPLLRKAVGPRGHIIGIDLTEPMLDRARGRVERHGWTNVELHHVDAARFEFPRGVHGILSTFALTLVPDFDGVIQRGARALASGGRWVVADLKLPGGLAGRLTPLLLPLFRPFGVTLDLATRHPWESLERYLTDVTRVDGMFGFVYVASGVAPVRPSPGSSAGGEAS